jgi:hypothetical protein
MGASAPRGKNVTYVVVVLVVVAVLYGSFRALGGGAPVPAEDYRVVLGRLAEFTTARVAELEAALERPRTPPAGPSNAAARAPVDPLVETASEARKKLTGYRQQLARLEVEATGDELETLSSARSLLGAAVEDHAWVCRLLEGGTYHENPGIQDAVTALRDHGRRCLEAAASLLAGSAAGALSG